MKPMRFAALIAVLILSACSIVDGFTDTSTGPTPYPVASPTPWPSTEVTFFVTPPEGTPTEAEISLELVDEVTGLAFSSVALPMERSDQGTYSLRLTPPAGSLLRYRYIRTSPESADEVDATNESIDYRLLQVTGPMQVNDLIAGWTDAHYEGPTGRIVGQVLSAQDDQPLAEIIVGAGGQMAFTDAQGNFRIERLQPGTQTVTFVSPTGAHHTLQQGAVVAADSTTPANVWLEPAQSVKVTFQVTVPSDTIPGSSLRLAGNVLQLGNIFGELSGTQSIAGSLAPTMVMIDETHYLTVVELYAGTDLRYKYTLGDGLWNAERDPQGFFVTRQIIVPDQDLVVQDTVSSWHVANQGTIRFYLDTPGHTPETDSISLQFNPFVWFEPLPMWRLGENEWFFVLYGPLDFSQPLGYRYCRNQLCDGADDEDTYGDNITGRPVSGSSANQDLIDTVNAWQWWPEEQSSVTVVAPGEIDARPGFETGVSLVPDFRPGWLPILTGRMSTVASLGVNTVELTPPWMLTQNAPTPLIQFDPRHTPFSNSLHNLADRAHSAGLRVVLRPELITPDGSSLASWWLAAPRDYAWWTIWFEQYRAYLLNFAALAEMIEADKLVISGAAVSPAFLGGELLDGTASGSPPDADLRWRDLIAEVQEIYSGPVALEIEVGAENPDFPPFIDIVDQVHIYWHPSLQTELKGVSGMQNQAAMRLDQLLANRVLMGKPIILNVEYLSIQGGSSGCAPAPDGSCRAPADFDMGQQVDPDLAVNLEEQAQAINAVLLEAYSRDRIQGFYIRRFNLLAALLDKSASIYGKPAGDVLWYWFGQLTNTSAE